MPQYCYRCGECGNRFTDFRPIEKRNQGTLCACGALTERDFLAEGSPNSMNDAFHKPIEMYSIAPNTPAEKRVLEKAGATFGEGDVPLARTRAEKLRLLKAVDFVETK